MEKILKKASILLFIASFLFVISCAKGFAEMTFEENEFDFGNIVQGDKVVHDFKFTNTGNTNLVIDGAKGSCGCTVPTYPKEPIEPGKSGSIKVAFDSHGKMGETKKTVTIMCNVKEKIKILNIKSTIDVPQQAK
jgi:hypothetical protein